MKTFIITTITAIFALGLLVNLNAQEGSGTRSYGNSKSASSEGSGTYSSKKSGPALDGYCPVAYHKMGKAVKGKKEFETRHKGKTYLFVKEKARDAFIKTPEKFLPVNNGKCIVCKVNLGKVVPGDPEYFSVYKNKLYLFPSDKQKAMFDEEPGKYAVKTAPVRRSSEGSSRRREGS